MYSIPFNSVRRRRCPLASSPKPRPRSAAPSYMRATYSRNGAVPAFALGPALRLLRRPRCLQSDPTDASAACSAANYVLDEAVCGGGGGGGGGDDTAISEVPRPRQCFGVRTVSHSNGVGVSKNVVGDARTT